MSKTNPKTEKVSKDMGTGRFLCRQYKSRNFIRKEENSVRRCKDINNCAFDLVP